jgi:hypothetical protein
MATLAAATTTALPAGSGMSELPPELFRYSRERLYEDVGIGMSS